MFSHLRGILTDKQPGSAIVECCGVGYDVRIPMSTYDKLPDIGSETKLLIHFSMSDDGIRLFGFSTNEERELFRQLIAVSQIGPKVAMGVLSGLSVSRFVDAILSGDIGLLAKVPGLGRKTAQRLVVELKDKVTQLAGGYDEVPGGKMAMDVLKEAESALVTLGYRAIDVRQAWKTLLIENPPKDSETLIKATIQHLYKKRTNSNG